jgi:hypothetical protein
VVRIGGRLRWGPPRRATSERRGTNGTTSLPFEDAVDRVRTELASRVRERLGRVVRSGGSGLTRGNAPFGAFGAAADQVDSRFQRPCTCKEVRSLSRVRGAFLALVVAAVAVLLFLALAVPSVQTT